MFQTPNNYYNILIFPLKHNLYIRYSRQTTQEKYSKLKNQVEDLISQEELIVLNNIKKFFHK
jgi:hypothetical protein